MDPQTWPPDAIFEPPDATLLRKSSFRSEPPDANFPELKFMSRVSDKKSVEDLSVKMTQKAFCLLDEWTPK